MIDQALLDRAKGVDLVELASRYTQLKKDGNDHCGPCPICGGEDRFVVMKSNKWFCRKCTSAHKPEDTIGFVLFVDRRRPVIPAQEDMLWAVEVLTGDKSMPVAAFVKPAKKPVVERTVTSATLFELESTYHDLMDNAARAWWESSGISCEWQDYFRLGWAPEKKIKIKEELKTVSAFCIPYHGLDGETQTIQYRIANPGFEKKNRYRWHYGAGPSFFVARTDLGITDQVFIFEGAKKAMVAASHVIEKYQCLAIPSTDDFCGIEEYVKACGRVWIFLDPDSFFSYNATPPAYQLAKNIGKQARIVRTHSKIDDMILAGAGRKELAGLLRWAETA